MAMFKTHTQRMREGNERIDRKHGRTPSSSAPATTKKESNWLGISAKMLMPIAISLVLFVIWLSWEHGVKAWNWAINPETVLSRLVPALILLGTVLAILRLAGKEKLQVMRSFVLALMILVIGLSLFAWNQGTPLLPEDKEAPRIPLASDPEPSWPQVVMEPFSGSIRFPVLKLSKPVFLGQGFLVYCRFQEDGIEKRSPLLDRCEDDPNIYEARLVDISGNQNFARYAYAR